MAILRSQQGAALITALMLTMLSLVIAMALLTMATTRTQVSASQKRYRSSLTAAQGGVELIAREIVPRLFRGDTHDSLEEDYSLIDLRLSQSDCLRQKLELARGGWTSCSQAQASLDAAQAPDASFRLSGLAEQKGFRVTTKIVDTVPGNSDRSGSGLLEPGDSVAGKDEVIHPQHVPGMLNISVQGAREEQGVREKASLSVLYAF